MKEYLLTTRDLTKRYGHQKAVDRVSVHIRKGAVYGLIGRNGAGKTSFLRMIAGLSRPTGGEISLFGYTGKELNGVRTRVGCLIEGPGLYPNMSAYENLRTKCILLGIHRKGYEEELLRLVGLSGTGKKRAGHFSLGMRQRLGIALALVGEPDLLILDEPVNGLDPQGIVEVRETIQKLNQERNITIIISSHILEELSKIATDYGIIDRGSLIQEITREELLQRCSERIEIVMEHPERAVPVLDRMGFTKYRMADRERICIFERLSEGPQVNLALTQAGLLVKSIGITSEELENYFIQLVGGGKNA